MKIDSAGILFVCRDRCLLAHSTSARRFASWMPPKGHLEDGESIEQAAIREVKEEIGWEVKGAFLNDSFDILYNDRKGKIYKTVRIFVVRIENQDPDKNGPFLRRIGDLQREEVDEIRWCNSEEVAKLALPRYTEAIINVLNKTSNETVKK
jgi:8-oxo-dGTP pyrophosphatase MutT (NUDIX family)